MPNLVDNDNSIAIFHRIFDGVANIKEIGQFGTLTVGNYRYAAQLFPWLEADITFTGTLGVMSLMIF